MPFQKLGVGGSEGPAFQNGCTFSGFYSLSAQLSCCLCRQENRFSICVCGHKKAFAGWLLRDVAERTAAADEQGIAPVPTDCLQKGIELTRFLIHAFTSIIRYHENKKGSQLQMFCKLAPLIGS